MLLREVKSIFHRELDTIYGHNEVSSFFYLLIEHYLQLERFSLALTPDITIDKEMETAFFKALERLKRHEPIQYIMGVAHFMEMRFRVDRSVLIPRPETEELVQWILDAIPHAKGLRILDIGTGSGCIAIALAKHLPGAQVYALDISEKALETAKANAVAHGVPITFLKRDVRGLQLNQEFDIIVSNPPYVRESEKKGMQAHVLQMEPKEALFVTDADPLVFYRAICTFAMAHLKPGGRLYFEINQYLGRETQELLHERNFSEIELRKDIFGHDRMLKGILDQTE